MARSSPFILRHRFLSILLTILLPFVSPYAHSASSVNLLFPTLLNADYIDENSGAETGSGLSIISDWHFGDKGAFAIDFHALANIEEVRNEDDRFTYTADLTNAYNVLFLGYRHRFNHFFIGGGGAVLGNCLSYVNERTSKNTGDKTIAELSLLNCGSVSIPALTLGYRYVTGIGITVGAHIFYSLPADLDIAEECLDDICIAGSAAADFKKEDFSLAVLGLLIGYTWK